MLVRVDGDRGAIVAVGCETEPVSKNEDFGAFAERALELAFTEGPDALADLEEERVELVGRLGENIVLRGAARMEAADGRAPRRVRASPGEQDRRPRAGARERGARRGWSRCTSRPRARSTRGARRCPRSEIQQEREIYEKLPEVGSKPEHIRPQIVEGMIAKRFFADNVLLDQAWIHEPSLTVGKALAEHGAEVLEFVRYSVTE